LFKVVLFGPFRLGLDTSQMKKFPHPVLSPPSRHQPEHASISCQSTALPAIANTCRESGIFKLALIYDFIGIIPFENESSAGTGCR
jgi:hypothetical protein